MVTVDPGRVILVVGPEMVMVAVGSTTDFVTMLSAADPPIRWTLKSRRTSSAPTMIPATVPMAVLKLAVHIVPSGADLSSLILTKRFAQFVRTKARVVPRSREVRSSAESMCPVAR
jgi:hypothetical protein